MNLWRCDMRLQEITAMKLQQIAALNKEIQLAIEKGWEYHQQACELELAQAKYDVTHPQRVLDDIDAIIAARLAQ